MQQMLWKSIFSRQQPTAELKEAVSSQLFEMHGELAGKFLDSVEDINRKQANLDKISEWARNIEDKELRKAYEYAICVYQYTITRRRDELALKEKARSIVLPPLPRM